MQEVPPLFILLLGLIFLAIGAFSLHQVLLPFRWRKVPGQILYSQLMTTASRSVRGGASTLYAVQIRYRYQVENRAFTSEQISRSTTHGAWMSRFLSFPGLLKRYPIGAEVTVYVNPKDPSEAVLEQIDKPFLILFAVSLLIVIYCFSLYMSGNPIYYTPASSGSEAGVVGGE